MKTRRHPLCPVNRSPQPFLQRKILGRIDGRRPVIVLQQTFGCTATFFSVYQVPVISQKNLQRI